MTVLTLDKRSVAKLTALKDAENSPYWDTELKGFGLRLHVDSGNRLLRSFIIQYRIGSSQRKLKIGDASTLTVEQARKRAKEMLAKVALGVDPQAERETARTVTALKFSAAVQQYLDIKEKELRRASFKNCKLYLTGPRYFGTLHNMALNKIERTHVATCLNSIRLNSGTVSASRCRAWLSAFFVWAMQDGHTDANPVIGTRNPGNGKPRDRVLNDGELAAVWNACGDDEYGKIVRLMILTGCRRGEIGGLKWSEFNPDGTVTIPGERTKNGHAHTLPVAPAMYEIIKSVPHMVDRDHLFGSRSPYGFNAWRKREDVLDGIEAEWTLHDIRRSVATGMANLEIEPHIVEAVLNHRTNRAGVAGTYNRSPYTKQIARALAIWDEHVASILNGRAPKVVAFSTVGIRSK